MLSWVFAYGSNMATDDLKRRIVDEAGSADGLVRVAGAFLPDHQLVWNYRSSTRKGGAANVERCYGRELPGVALLVDEAVLGVIDRKEGHPSFYNRGASPVRLRLSGGEEINAWVYVAARRRCSPRPVLPRRAYLQLLIDGARQHGLPATHIAELEATPTAD